MGKLKSSQGRRDAVIVMDAYSVSLVRVEISQGTAAMVRPSPRNVMENAAKSLA
ncbi:hypothetical protein D1872_313160 [compost metagenome]